MSIFTTFPYNFFKNSSKGVEFYYQLSSIMGNNERKEYITISVAENGN